MTYIKVIQSFDGQIENLFIKIEKALVISYVSSLLMIFATAIIYNAISLNSYEALLIPFFLKLYLIIAGYVLLYLGIYQGILMVSRAFLLAKEIFMRVTRRYGIKKGATSLIKIFVGRRSNKFRSSTQNKLSQTTKIASGNTEIKNPVKETINEVNKLELPDKEKEKFNNKDTKPGPDTPTELLNDIEKLIKKLPKAYFHKDGKIKHTSAAKYALDPNKATWFAEKWDYGVKHIGNLIKREFKR